MRGKDFFLFLLGGGGIVALVHIWELPKAVDMLASRVSGDEAFANQLDKRTLVLETNNINQMSILREIKDGQIRLASDMKTSQGAMWHAIRENGTKVIIKNTGGDQ